MEFQPAVRKSPLQSITQRDCLCLTATVTDRIISVALERDVRMIPSHPVIERIVEKEIREHGTNDRPLRRSFSRGKPTSHQASGRTLSATAPRTATPTDNRCV